MPPSHRGYQLLPTSVWLSPPPRTPTYSKKKILIATALVLSTFLFTAWTYNNNNNNNNSSTPHHHHHTLTVHIPPPTPTPPPPPPHNDRPVLPSHINIAKVPVVGEVDGTGRRQLDLGHNAESKYNLAGVDDTPSGSRLFFERLRDFAEDKMPDSLKPHMLDALAAYLPPKLAHSVHINTTTHDNDVRTPMIMHKNIFQTDRKPPGQLTDTWAELNKQDGWVLDFYSDDRAQEWVDDTFPADPNTHSVSWAYRYMQRGVLKADFLRYLLPLVHGGVYSDTDTKPKTPIEQWGTHSPEYYDISATDGDYWFMDIEDEPAVIVGVDIDVHERTDYERFHWWQPLGICQWALSSAPYHPIMQEITRRVVNNTEFVYQKAQESPDPNPKPALQVLKWTGPVAFTDSVLSYIMARYNVPWRHLRGIRRPLRIGEVMILPITAFSPGGEKDFGAESAVSEQCALQHMFSGSWKSGGA